MIACHKVNATGMGSLEPIELKDRWAQLPNRTIHDVSKDKDQIGLKAVDSVDNALEAARANDAALAGQMWHPEREMPFAARDIQTIAAFFGGGP
jgi:gamma-glutamyl-gamma-aminobutyrate hydrolase PuuD